MSWLSEMILIGGLTAYISCATIHFINPIHGYFWQHEFKALVPLYIPFVDESTVVGFTILLSIQTIEAFFAALTSGAADFPFMITVINVWIFSAIFHDHVNELNGILHEKKVDMPMARATLQSITEMYCDIWM